MTSFLTKDEAGSIAANVVKLPDTIMQTVRDARMLPEVNGDPLDQGGALCLSIHFGWDFVGALTEAG